MEPNTAYLSLGANLGDKAANMRQAVRLIAANESCTVVAASSLYVTSPVGVEDQPDFLNAVVAVSTTLTPSELLDLCREIEKKIGRKRTIRWGPRVIDIDILLYEGVDIAENDLTVPHPHMMERAFVLAPLAEIAPELVVPGGVTAREAVENVDGGGVRIVDGGGSWIE